MSEFEVTHHVFNQPTVPVNVMKMGTKDRPATAEDIADMQELLKQVVNDPNLMIKSENIVPDPNFDPSLLRVKGNGRRKGPREASAALEDIADIIYAHTNVDSKELNSEIYKVLNQLIDDRPSDREREDEKQYVKGVAGAINKVVQKYGHANVRLVGASALNSAVKAIINSQSELLRQGVKISTEFSYQDLDIGGSVKTGLMLHVRV